MTNTDDFPHPAPNHFHISVNGHPTAPIVRAKIFGVSFDSSFSQYTCKSSASSVDLFLKIFPESDYFSPAPLLLLWSKLLLYLILNSFWHSTLPPHNLFFSSQSFPSKTWILWSKPCINFLFYAKSKFHKSSPGSREAGPFNTSLIISKYFSLPHHFIWAFPLLLKCIRIAHTSGRILSLRYPRGFSSSSSATPT